MRKLFQRWLRPGPPVLDATPTYWQLRRLARLAHGDVAYQAREQAAWTEDVLNHHPLLDDLTRTIQQSADLLRALSANEARPAA